MQKFYAITGLGWGTGDSVTEALDNYLKAQRRNFPNITPEDLDEAWGFVWAVPEGTTGFFHDWQNGLTWSSDGDETQTARTSQRVSTVGKVPESLRVFA